MDVGAAKGMWAGTARREWGTGGIMGHLILGFLVLAAAAACGVLLVIAYSFWPWGWESLTGLILGVGALSWLVGWSMDRYL